MTWIRKASLPYDISYGFTVQYKNSFVIVGGDSSNGQIESEKGIVFYDVRENQWEILDVRLTTDRTFHTAFLVSNKFC